MFGQDAALALFQRANGLRKCAQGGFVVARVLRELAQEAPGLVLQQRHAQSLGNQSSRAGRTRSRWAITEFAQDRGADQIRARAGHHLLPTAQLVACGACFGQRLFQGAGAFQDSGMLNAHDGCPTRAATAAEQRFSTRQVGASFWKALETLERRGPLQQYLGQVDLGFAGAQLGADLVGQDHRF